jgi:hypothetical protein
VAARVALVALSILALAWIGVLLRDHEVGQATTARLLGSPQLPPDEYAREVERLEDAELLNPDTTPKLYRGTYWLKQSPRRAAEVLEDLLRSEPENVQAWSVLVLVTEDFDPDRAAEARAQISRLNPLGAHR